jgi:hypothetical protein
MMVYHQADPVLRACEKNLGEAQHLLSSEEYHKLERLCQQMRSAVDRRDAEQTQNLKYQLNAASVSLAEKLIQSALQKK